VGFSFIDNVPPTPEATKELIEKLAYIMHSHYGGFWDFTSDLRHSDTAYTPLPLPAHNDTTYYGQSAGLQLFVIPTPEPINKSTVSKYPKPEVSRSSLMDTRQLKSFARNTPSRIASFLAPLSPLTPLATPTSSFKFVVNLFSVMTWWELENSFKFDGITMIEAR
jgi:Taurine catabolism dioxygenase TauD, TfdA family